MPIKQLVLTWYFKVQVFLRWRTSEKTDLACGLVFLEIPEKYKWQMLNLLWSQFEHGTVVSVRSSIKCFRCYWCQKVFSSWRTRLSKGIHDSWWSIWIWQLRQPGHHFIDHTNILISFTKMKSPTSLTVTLNQLENSGQFRIFRSCGKNTLGRWSAWQWLILWWRVEGVAGELQQLLGT